jgi:electron transfer flavoprotein alpha subunit
MSKILAFIESRNNKIKNNGFETASLASRISKEISAEVSALLIGSEVSGIAGQLHEYGIEKIYIIEDNLLEKYSSTAYSRCLAEAIKITGSDIVFMSATSMGKDLAPLVSAKLDAGLASDCTDIRTENGTIIARRPVYAGKSFIELKIISDVKIFSFRPNVFKPEINKISAGTIEKLNINISDSDLRTVVKEVTQNTGKLDVTEADIVVSGGRGLKGPENFYLIEELAKVLGGAAGASRAVVDAGWRPHEDQVGQTGKTVSPKLYIAAGISGAIQHLAGMSSSKCIVAINKDKDAPIFQVADYGIIGDALEILPVLTQEFKKVLSN